jgi:hypothetical protein
MEREVKVAEVKAFKTQSGNTRYVLRGGEGGNGNVEGAAWSAAVEAAPSLLGTSEPKEKLAADEFFETLKPFKELVAEDIREGSDDDAA